MVNVAEGEWGWEGGGTYQWPVYFWGTRCCLLQGIRAWRENYGTLFEDGEIDAIFNLASQKDGGFLVLLKMDRKRYNKKLHHLQSPLKAGL
ncbi:MAG: hypothetical protein J6R96_06185 [Spirochaetaceae bacterium]|nr:hypothetical protein [Spirochaetaceae bacterium]